MEKERIVERIVEVPVEKIITVEVEKRVEVPTEKIVEVIKYVPIVEAEELEVRGTFSRGEVAIQKRYNSEVGV